MNREDWEGNKSKKSRKLGKEYFGKKKLDDGKWKYDVKRKERKMKARCSCKNKENSLIKCSLITESDRKLIFDEFWNMDWEAKKLYVQFLTKKQVLHELETERIVRKVNESFPVYNFKKREQFNTCV